MSNPYSTATNNIGQKYNSAIMYEDELDHCNQSWVDQMKVIVVHYSSWAQHGYVHLLQKYATCT